jgi:hypothetical protein
VRLALYLLKRTLRYSVPLSVIGAFLTTTSSPFQGVRPLAAVIAGIFLRFAVIASTVGYLMSLFLYIWISHRELPLYAVCGRQFGRVAAFSFAIMFSCLGVLVAAFLLAAKWTGA